MNTYTPEVKASVVAAWMAGASLNQLVAQFSVPKATLQGWMKGQTRTAVVLKPKAEPDWQTIDDIAEDWTRTQGLASIAILRKAQDDSWLDRQNAHDLGVLYGIIADKQLRLFAAFKPRASDDVNLSANRAGETQSA